MESNSLTVQHKSVNQVKCLFGYHDYDNVWQLDKVRAIHICSSCETVARIFIDMYNTKTYLTERHLYAEGKVLYANGEDIVVKLLITPDKHTIYRVTSWMTKNGRKLYVLGM